MAGVLARTQIDANGKWRDPLKYKFDRANDRKERGDKAKEEN